MKVMLIYMTDLKMKFENDKSYDLTDYDDESDIS